MGGARRSRDSGGTGSGAAKLGALLAEGLLRRELMVGAVLFSSLTIVVGLSSESLAWQIGYCVAGGSGIVASFVGMRRKWQLQWLFSIGVLAFNGILLVVHGRIFDQV
ncbi:hypothetical protein [Nocardia sp. NPDC019395]|uniref:hypothetical protein n=1 Tax=Nocardia sp. NPDC019395 TaxID=3154686 RepID=UPI0033DCCC07